MPVTMPQLKFNLAPDSTKISNLVPHSPLPARPRRVRRITTLARAEPRPATSRPSGGVTCPKCPPKSPLTATAKKRVFPVGAVNATTTFPCQPKVIVLVGELVPMSCTTWENSTDSNQSRNSRQLRHHVLLTELFSKQRRRHLDNLLGATLPMQILHPQNVCC